MKEPKKYWAAVGRVPEAENDVWTAGERMTQAKAYREFRRAVLDGGGVDAKEAAELKASYGTAVILDALFSSEMLIVFEGGDK